MSGCVLEMRRLNVLNEEDMKAFRKDITTLSATLNAGMRASWYLVGLPSVLTGSKSLTSVEVNSVAPMMERPETT